MPETVDVTGLVLLGKSENRKPMGFLPSNIGLSGSNFPIIQFYEIPPQVENIWIII
jgi:hypothetical protein